MARIDEDIVAKAAFYAGLAQTLAPAELPEDIRTNGNSLLKDVVESVCADKKVDRGFVKKVIKVEEGGNKFRTIDKCVPFNVMYKGELLTLCGIEDFMTIYKDCKNVACIYHSVEEAEERMPIGSQFSGELRSIDLSDDNGDVLVDENGSALITNDIHLRDCEDDVIIVETHLEADEEIIVLCNRTISLDDTLGYYRVDCRKEVRAYITDYLSFLMATMYQMATKDDCASRMQLSLNHCTKIEVPHMLYADVVQGMKNMRGQSPNMRSGKVNYERGY